MSDNKNDNTPSAEQIRKARHEGFADSVSHMPDERRQKFSEVYRKADGRRERNVAGFYNTVLGQS